MGSTPTSGPMKKETKLYCGDCLHVLRSLPANHVDLIMGSPPYEDAREYGELGFNLTGDEWVSWMVMRMEEMVRVCKGLVAMVVSDKVVDYQWSAVTALLMAALKKGGFYMRRPPLYVRHGIPGSGGKDWFKNRYETIVCVTAQPGELPWHDNTACGHPPRTKVGGPHSYRRKDGRRDYQKHKQPAKSNPGNIIDCGSNTHLGYGNVTEAPYPEKVPNFFIRSFCPTGGIVLDPFCGSGTTGEAALKCGREFIGIDIRESQIELTKERLGNLHTGIGL